jgi:signal peptidase
MTAPRDDEPSESEDSWVLFAQDIVTSVAAVLLVGVYLFAISGVWPPMVAIESGSMEPNMQVNDLAFVMETDRFQPDAAHDETGVVTARQGAETGYTQFGNSGDVIVFEPNGNGRRTPIIHRAMFWVEEGENWCEMANPAYLGDGETDARACEASHAGFITKGDANPTYDQVQNGLTEPVKPEWVVGTAEQRVPLLGWIRLRV